MNFKNGIRDFFSLWIPLKLEDAINEGEVGRESAFLTWQSFNSFSGATLVITVVWRVLQAVLPESQAIKSNLLPFILSLVIGGLQFVLDITDAKSADRTFNTILRKLILAIANSFFLASAALGINTTVLS